MQATHVVKMKAALVALLCVGWLAGLAVADKVVPWELPKPDGKPGSKDKPVKIYIMSGQSNMLGFGRPDGGSPAFSTIFLSADPNIKTGRTQFDAGLLPHYFWQQSEGGAKGATAMVFAGAYDAKADYASMKPAKQEALAFGDVSKDLPSIEGEHVVVVKGFIEVPMTGSHRIYAGFEDSSYAIATVNGKEVYRKVDNSKPVQTAIELEKGKRHPFSVIFLKGGKGVFWMELFGLKPKGTLRALTDEGRFLNMVDDKGNWTKRQDVMICDAYMGKGKYGPLTPNWRGKFGPELGFGYVMGEFHDEPVILMKADIGNRSLAWDILPPGSERYTVGDKVYAGYKDGQSSWPVGKEPKKGGWYAGKQYDDYTASIRKVLDEFDERFPQYKDQGYEIAGFVWWQGHKDQNPVHAARYEQNLVQLIKAWRKEFNAPNAKWAIATIAFGGWELSGPGKQIAEAQLAVSGETGKYPEFKGNVKTIEARDYWRTLGESPSGQGFHYNHNAETYLLVGDALGRAMVELHGGKAEPQKLPKRPPARKEPWPANPTLEEAAQMLYSDNFISPWGTDPAEPTAADWKKMAPALKPMIIDKLIPAYAASTPGVPAYRRSGMSLVPIVTGKPPVKPGSSMNSQLDRVIDYYNAAGIDTYNWKKWGPEMQNAKWHYFTFDPPEKQPKAKSGRYRKVTYPDGMDNWFAIDFDPVKAGWKLGEAPFANLNDQLPKTARGGLTPKTFWDKEVLMIRQTFKLPKMNADERYRLVVGGATTAFSGEGFVVYVNGKKFAEADDGFYKRGGTRGSYVFENFKPEFESGEVTIAVKTHLRYTYHKNKLGPTRGVLAVWMESAKLPQPVIEAVEKHVQKTEKKK